MMKVKHIKLEQFQAHERQLVKLSPNITTIIGASDRGKSAIIRALGWVCLNNFAGAEFVKHGAKKATVTIKVVHRGVNHLIERTRSASGATNTYEMDGDEFKAFGQNVPDDINELLRLSPINFQSQHDAPFWFSETAGEVSRQLNAIIDLSVIDSSLSFVAKLVREKEMRLSICDERVEQLESDLEKLAPQRERVKEFSKLELSETKRDEATTNQDRLSRLLGKIKTNRAKDLRRESEEGERVLERGRSAVDSRERVVSLNRLLEDGARLKENTTPPPSIDALAKLQIDALYDGARVDLLHLIIRKVKDRSGLALSAKAAIADAEERFHTETDGKPCPLCGHIS